MQKLPTQRLAEGMTLARAVATTQGQVLLKSGTRLTPQLIAQLQRLGIAYAAVAGRPLDSPDYPHFSVERRLKVMEAAFSRTSGDPTMGALKKVFAELAEAGFGGFSGAMPAPVAAKDEGLESLRPTDDRRDRVTDTRRRIVPDPPRGKGADGPVADAETIRARISRVSSLSSFPAVLQKLIAVADDEDAPMAEAARLIGSDEALAAGVLKLVNSAFYGLNRPITTISHAVSFLGMRAVRAVALGAAIADALDAAVRGLHQHSLACSIAAGAVARRARLPEPEEAQAAGLLHDIGKALLHMGVPAGFDLALRLREKHQCSIIEAERMALDGLSHCDIAARTMVEWNLPPALREPIVHHHSPRHAVQAPRQTAAVHIADILARASGFGYGGDPFVPAIDAEALRTLGLRIEDLKAVAEEMMTMMEKTEPEG